MIQQCIRDEAAFHRNPRVNRQPYSAPPITTAVIELRFENPIPEDVRSAVSKKLAQRYPLHNEVLHQTVKVEVEAAGGVKSSSAVEARIDRHMDADAHEIVNVGPNAFSVEVTAPYSGWDALFARLEEDWATAKKLWEYRKISRLGVRFVNRIDLKQGDGGIVDYEAYLNLRINLPEDFPPIGQYNLAFQFALADIKCGSTVRSGTEEPAVPGSTSFSLDVDVFRIVDVPQQDKDVYKLLAQMRSAKNNLFETFITDRAREIFNAAV